MKSIEEMFKNKLNTDETILRLFEKIFKKRILTVEYAGLEHFKTITEYDFSLFKVKITNELNETNEMYLKVIKGGKIKESIFCFWSLLYEEYIKDNKKIENNRKVIIRQNRADDSDSDIILTFDQNLDYCAEINLIEIQKFAMGDEILERWGLDLEVKSEDILFIARKNIL